MSDTAELTYKQQAQRQAMRQAARSLLCDLEYQHGISTDTKRLMKELLHACGHENRVVASNALLDHLSKLSCGRKTRNRMITLREAIDSCS